MKKNLVIASVAVAAAGVAAIAHKYLYTSAKAESKVKAVWAKHGEAIAKDLGLAQVPTLVFDGKREDHALMYVHRTTYYRSSWGLKTVEREETDYIIHVYAQGIAHNINELHAGLGRDVAEEFILALLRHECRHLHQIESGFNRGRAESMFDLHLDMIDGYGAKPGEQDANVYAIDAAQNKKERLVAQLSKAWQDEGGKMCPDLTELRKHAKAIRKLPFFERG